MNRDDLLHMLDLGAKEDVAASTEELSITSDPTSPHPSPSSPTALDLDDWATRRGREVRRARSGCSSSCPRPRSNMA